MCLKVLISKFIYLSVFKMIAIAYVKFFGTDFNNSYYISFPFPVLVINK